MAAESAFFRCARCNNSPPSSPVIYTCISKISLVYCEACMLAGKKISYLHLSQGENFFERRVVQPLEFTRDGLTQAARSGSLPSFLLALSSSLCLFNTRENVSAVATWIPLPYFPGLFSAFRHFEGDELLEIISGLNRPDSEKLSVTNWIRLDFKKELPPKNPQSIFQESKAGKDPLSQLNLALCYIHGRGVAKSEDEAKRILNNLEGVPYASFILGELSNGKVKIDAMLEALRKGCPQALVTKALHVFSQARKLEEIGPESDPVWTDAFTSLISASIFDMSNIFRDLGYCFQEGKGVARDPFFSFFYYKLALLMTDLEKPEYGQLRQVIAELERELQESGIIVSVVESFQNSSDPRLVYLAMLLLDLQQNSNLADELYKKVLKMGYPHIHFARPHLAKIKNNAPEEIKEEEVPGSDPVAIPGE